MKLKQIIKGLSEKDANPCSSDPHICFENVGFNECVNTEIEIDEGEIYQVLIEDALDTDNFKDTAKALSEAIQEGKVLKVVNDGQDL